MFRPNQAKPDNPLMRICRSAGNMSVFRVFMLIVGLQFFVAQGLTVLDNTFATLIPIQSGLVEKPIRISLGGQPIADEQDVCHPVPTDTDPSDKASGIVLHLDTLLRKDLRLLWHTMSHPFRIIESVGIPYLPCANEQYIASSSFLRPYFSEYPVYLIGDLPPPLF